MKRIKTFLFSNFFIFLGFSIWGTLFNNYAVEKFNITGTQIGIAQSIREIPGLLVFTVSFWALIVSEIKLAAISVILTGIGVLLCGYSKSFNFLMFSTFIMSIGFHYFYSLQQSAGSKIIISKKLAHFFSNMKSMSAFASVIGSLICFILLISMDYNKVFIYTGIIIIISGIILFFKSAGKIKPIQIPKIKLHKEYFMYYLIHMLMGLRRHIFTTFAIFLLVKMYKVDIQNIIKLLLAANIAGMILFRYFGHIINFLGGKNTLRLEFGLLSIVFLCYALIKNVYILYLLYFLDALLFGFNSSIDVYFKNIMKKRVDSSMTISTGFAINHITAVIIPIIGGLLWDKFNYKIPFILGSGIAIFSFIIITLDDYILKKVLREKNL